MKPHVPVCSHSFPENRPTVQLLSALPSQLSLPHAREPSSGRWLCACKRGFPCQCAFLSSLRVGRRWEDLQRNPRRGLLGAVATPMDEPRTPGLPALEDPPAFICKDRPQEAFPQPRHLDRAAGLLLPRLQWAGLNLSFSPSLCPHSCRQRRPQGPAVQRQTRPGRRAGRPQCFGSQGPGCGSHAQWAGGLWSGGRAGITLAFRRRKMCSEDQSQLPSRVPQEDGKEAELDQTVAAAFPTRFLPQRRKHRPRQGCRGHVGSWNI